MSIKNICLPDTMKMILQTWVLLGLCESSGDFDVILFFVRQCYCNPKSNAIKI